VLNRETKISRGIPAFCGFFRIPQAENGGQSTQLFSMTFDPRPYLKDLARGRHGARDLSREQAAALFGAILSGELGGAPLGAILVALRVKGESLGELAGMMDALATHVRPMRLPSRRAIPVVIPSHNGSRKLPNLVPLLALLIAREGVPVLVHASEQESARIGTLPILEMLGHPTLATIEDAESALEERELAPVTVGVISPDLSRLMDARLELGVRNSGHTMAKLMLPMGVSPASACRLVAVTHPDFLKLMREHFVQFPANAFVMRGVEGEPVVRLREPQPMEEMRSDGSTITHLLREGDSEFALPGRDAEATAKWTRAVLEGEAQAPVAITRQVALIVEHCRGQGSAARAPLRLVSSQ
jgi:anthranilate phosphoribosyltransferase